MCERTVEVDSLAHASEQLKATVKENEYSASDMRKGCGDVTDKNDNLVAVVSYNGRVWSHRHDHKDCAEIKI